MKRFTETDKWKDEWFLDLPFVSKTVFLFLLENCDNAGFIAINPRLNAFLIGIEQDQYLGAIQGLNRAYVGSNCKTKLWLKKFLFHQKNVPLNENNNAHKQIIHLIKLNMNNFDYNFQACPLLGAKEGLFSPIGKGTSNGSGKGKGPVKVSYTPEFESFWKSYEMKGNKKTAFTQWRCLTIDQQSEASRAIPFYAIEQPDKKFRKDAERYLRDRLFESINERGDSGTLVLPNAEPSPQPSPAMETILANFPKAQTAETATNLATEDELRELGLFGE